MIKQHMQCEPCTTERGGITRMEGGKMRRNLEFNPDETESSDLKSSYKTGYVVAENLIQRMHAESSGGHDYSCETRQGEAPSSYRASAKLSSTTQKEKFRKSVSSKACCRGYESRESSSGHFSVNSWAILDHPHTLGQ